MQGRIPFRSISCPPEPYREAPSPDMSPASASSSSIAGDHIGLESCLDMVKLGELQSSPEEVVAAASPEYCYYSERVQQRREERREMRRKEYPPPIPLLSRTENLAAHMPWVLKRYYTSDGRLILREEKVRHHEYLRAHRADGRLTLHLVPMDDNFTILPPPPRDHCIQEVEEDEEPCFDCEIDEKEEHVEHEAEQIGDGDLESSVVNAGKCLAYTKASGNGVGTSIFGVPISPIRPVHS